MDCNLTSVSLIPSSGELINQQKLNYKDQTQYTRDGGTTTKVDPRALDRDMSWTISEIMLRVFPRPISSATMPPKNGTGRS